MGGDISCRVRCDFSIEVELVHGDKGGPLQVRLSDRRDNEGWIYVLSTRDRPTILKIGMTTRSVAQRVAEINSATGVPIPYSARKVVRVRDAARAEREIHARLDEYRLRNDREFFEVPFSTACRVIDEYIASAMERLRLRGRLKWFDPDKGYGFVSGGADDGDYFVHVSEVMADEVGDLHEGAEVEFDPGLSPKGQCALALRVVREGDAASA